MRHVIVTAVLWALAAWTAPARADTVTDWNATVCDIVAASGMATHAAVRAMAITHTATYEAAVAVAGDDAKTSAAIAAAHRTVLSNLLPKQRMEIEDAYDLALARIEDEAARARGIAAGERAARDVLARRAVDVIDTPEAYRPHTTPGRYVPTPLPVASQWSTRKPWLMTRAAMLRPGPPTRSSSARWARDFNETRTLGARSSALRTSEQTEVARFWETTHPPIYHGVLRSAALTGGRDQVRNARLFAAATQAMDDAMIAVTDAKYHYAFWRPITAIRNGDIDGNRATRRDPTWQPLIDTPLHPEYPCAHCIQAGAVAEVLQAEFGRAVPPLETASVTARGASRRWASVDAFVSEVSDARVHGGVHFRHATEVGTDMGRRIGALAVQRFFGP